MNKFTFMITLIFLTVVNTMAQQQTTNPQEPPKKSIKTTILQETAEPIKNKSNRIIFHFNDTSGLFSSLSKILTDRGYDIETKDRETGVIKTKTRDMPGGWAFSVQIRALFRDSTVTFSATQPKDFSFDVFYLTGKGTTFNKIWNEIIVIGEELKPIRIGYLYVK